MSVIVWGDMELKVLNGSSIDIERVGSQYKVVIPVGKHVEEGTSFYVKINIGLASWSVKVEVNDTSDGIKRI